MTKCKVIQADHIDDRIVCVRAVHRASEPRISSIVSTRIALRNCARNGGMASTATQTRSKLGTVYDRSQIEQLQQQYLNELRRMYTATKCVDCAGVPANWATLKRAAFVCINCAQTLRADASNRVKNCLGTYLWHPDEMELMRNASRS